MYDSLKVVSVRISIAGLRVVVKCKSLIILHLNLPNWVLVHPCPLFYIKCDLSSTLTIGIDITLATSL